MNSIYINPQPLIKKVFEPVLSLFLSFTSPLCFVKRPSQARANNKSIISLALSSPSPLYSSIPSTGSVIPSQQRFSKTLFRTQFSLSFI